VPDEAWEVMLSGVKHRKPREKLRKRRTAAEE